MNTVAGVLIAIAVFLLALDIGQRLDRDGTQVTADQVCRHALSTGLLAQDLPDAWLTCMQSVGRP